MALPVNHPLNEYVVYAYSGSVGASPVAAYAYVPTRGKVVKVGSVLGAALSSSDATVTTAINGTAITGGSFTITQSGSAAGDIDTATPTGADTVNEGDYISWTPASGGGASVPGHFFAVIRMS